MLLRCIRVAVSSVPHSTREVAYKSANRCADIVEVVMRPTPRKFAFVWALYCWTRVVAYLGVVPVQLESINLLTPSWMHLWEMWVFPAVLLTIGSLPPDWRDMEQIIRGCRVIGGVLTASLLAMWAVAFLEAEAARSWVSASNYIFLAFGALTTSHTLGRKRPREPGEVVVR